MKIDKSKTVSFSGHRPFKMDNGEASLFDDPQNKSSLPLRTENTLRHLCEKGYDTFLCGMAEGFDLTAGEVVLKLQKEFPNIRLLAVVPYPGQSASFADDNKTLYEHVLSRAAGRVTICPDYSHDCFHRRNDFLVENSTVLVCCYNGTKGGTEYTVKLAIKQRLNVINILY